MTTAAFIASQRAGHGVPHAVSCRALGVAESTFYKWHNRRPSTRQRRRAGLDAAVKASFEASGRQYGSPRVHVDLVEDGWRVGQNTVAASMRRQGLVARPKKRRRSLTRADRRKVAFPDLIGRDYTAAAPNLRWVGDLTEIPTGEGKLYLATVEDLFSRALPGFAIGERHDAELACEALRVAIARRGGIGPGVIFHTDRGGEYTADATGELCGRVGIVQSMGRVGSALDNAAAESFNSTLEFEVLSRYEFATKEQARIVVATWIVDTYNVRRRHSSAAMLAPLEYERRCAEIVGWLLGEPNALAQETEELSSTVIDEAGTSTYAYGRERRATG